MAIDKDLPDRLLERCDPLELFACDGLVDDLKKAFSECILNAGLDTHPSAEHGEAEAPRRPRRC